ncbi:hypothetical protein HK102_001139 [Quaeritorhiza haematococci]|nr:hypothetical protein HK102_001139 [Quaeritorhiza haematococci]
MVHFQKPELRTLALKSVNINSLLNYIEEALRFLTREYQVIANITQKEFEKFDEILQAEGGNFWSERIKLHLSTFLLLQII